MAFGAKKPRNTGVNGGGKKVAKRLPVKSGSRDEEERKRKARARRAGGASR